MTRVDERRRSGPACLIERCADAVDTLIKAAPRRDDMAEGDQGRAVTRLQPIEHGPARGLEMAEAQSLQARAHVERKNHVQRDLLEAGEIDPLSHAVVLHLKVG